MLSHKIKWFIEARWTLIWWVLPVSIFNFKSVYLFSMYHTISQWVIANFGLIGSDAVIFFLLFLSLPIKLSMVKVWFFTIQWTTARYVLGLKIKRTCPPRFRQPESSKNFECLVDRLLCAARDLHRVLRCSSSLVRVLSQRVSTDIFTVGWRAGIQSTPYTTLRCPFET